MNKVIECRERYLGRLFFKDMSKRKILTKLILFIYDAAAVVLASYLALLVRHDLQSAKVPKEYMDIMKQSLWVGIGTMVLCFALFRLYSTIWSYVGATEFKNIVLACGLASLLDMGLIMALNTDKTVPLPRSYYLLYMVFLLLLTLVSRFFYRTIFSVKKSVTDTKQRTKKKRVLVVGAGSGGNDLIREIKTSDYLDMKVVGVIDDNVGKVGNYIHGVKVLGSRHDIPKIAEKTRAEEIILAMPSAKPKEIHDILEICKVTGCELKKMPGIYQLVTGEVNVTDLREVDLNDLLGRDPIKVNIDSIMDYVSDKVIMVTGGGGSIGSELCRQIASHNPKQLIIIDIYENTTYDIQNELKRTFPDLNLVVLIASVRNTKRIDQIFEKYRPDIVYHAAAHKHVPLMEDSPNEAIKNNVLGTWKIVQASDKWKVKRFVMISTDKAVNPTNIMGASKRICEMIIQTYDKMSETSFVAVRFGNVLGSNGSVIPLFKKQIAEGGPVTVTHENIIRYFMTIPEAVSLVLQAGAYAKGGEIFVLDMGEPVRIMDLAKNLILLSGHKPNEDIMIKITGLRPGEKLYEEMLMKEEGMQETENRLIHIGKPIEMDESKFMEQLTQLGNYVVNEPDDIREFVQQIVPTYHPNRDNIEQESQEEQREQEEDVAGKAKRRQAGQE
ncbi:MAG: polysaccharide biosynthesis protein [Eubacterium sp.]|nr:polysaccharide biosynthesis protein [Eubacterium sp.]